MAPISGDHQPIVLCRKKSIFLLENLLIVLEQLERDPLTRTWVTSSLGHEIGPHICVCVLGVLEAMNGEILWYPLIMTLLDHIPRKNLYTSIIIIY